MRMLLVDYKNLVKIQVDIGVKIAGQGKEKGYPEYYNRFECNITNAITIGEC